jgi:alpha-L-fucosidase
MITLRHIASLMMVLMGISTGQAQIVELPEMAEGPYQPNEASLSRHQAAPEWFRDAKFGIYFHWGVYSVPAFGTEWYPRWMHFENRDEYRHHLATYGHPSQFGYHDFVPMFKAEHFDAEAWATLFEKAGAKFAGPVAEHHDGFSMWASKVNPWNAADMGPRRDITGELATAIRAHNMRLITTFHHARNLQRLDQPGEPYPGGKHFSASHYPPIDGMPTMTDDPKLQILYGRIAPERFHRMWKAKLFEVIDQYQPDIIWFDSWLDQIPQTDRDAFCAYYFNRAAQWQKDVLVVRKQDDLPLSHSIEDFEKGRAVEILDQAWLTDDTISLGSWCYTDDLKIKSTRYVLHVLIDIVSKNGQLLLNISPKADGTIPEDQRQVLLGIGAWLDRFGEAIYNTRPWVVSGEGPTTLAKGGGFADAAGKLHYTPQDIRYTRSKDGKALYAIIMGWPGIGAEINLSSLTPTKLGGNNAIEDVTLLGREEKSEWALRDEGLVVKIPEVPIDQDAWVIRIAFR